MLKYQRKQTMELRIARREQKCRIQHAVCVDQLALFPTDARQQIAEAGMSRMSLETVFEHRFCLLLTRLHQQGHGQCLSCFGKIWLQSNGLLQ